MNKLILANPGTGKTTTLARRVIALLKEGASPKDILCITFTEKAASEMNQKIRLLAQEEGLDSKLHELNIHTFHSYALSYLEEDGGEYGILGNNAIRYSIYKSFEGNQALNYPISYIISDIVPKVENAIRYLKSYGITPEQIDLKKCTKEIEKAYTDNEIDNITIEEQAKFAEYFVAAFKDYEGSKKTGYIDYNDMLLHFVRIPNKKKFKFVLVDELQDVNELEAEIAIQSGDELFLVGDRKQSIFGFQGGSVRNFKVVEEKLKPKKEILVENYRSVGQVIEYASKHFSSKTMHKEHAAELKGFTAKRKEQGTIEIIETGKGQQENAAVKKALELMDGKTTAIITRSNKQIIDISKILDSKGVSYSTTISNATSSEAKGSITVFLKGLLMDDNGSIVNALFTPFPGTRLKEAFEISKIYNDRKLDEKVLKARAPAFMKLRESAFSRPALLRIFDDVILPISVSIGKDYYITAVAIRRNIAEFFDTINAPLIADLFNYLDVTEESYEPIGKQEGLVLTTVHKSKGLEFDNVIYVPKATRSGFSFVDAVVYGIIKGTKGIDITEELEEESLRVDFVAFTRAKDNLYIVANNSNSSDYVIDGHVLTKFESMDDEPEPLSRKFDEAYSLFVNGRYEDSKKAIKSKDPWLKDRITSYFGSTNRLSYTMIERIADPFEFLRSNIMGLRDESPALNLGNSVHKMAEDRFNKTLKKSGLSKEETPFLDNIEGIDKQVREKFGAAQISAEDEIILPLVALVGKEAPKEMEFKAKLDAVYKTKDGYVIVDWKTDKTNERSSEHRRQLATYRKLYSIANSIDEDKISIALGFVALRGKVNTGKLGSELDTRQPKPQQYETVMKHVRRFIEFRERPELFMDEVLKQKDQGILHQMIKRELS